MYEYIKRGTRTLNIEVVKQRSCSSTYSTAMNRVGTQICEWRVDKN